jgi:hypothetical protein
VTDRRARQLDFQPAQRQQDVLARGFGAQLTELRRQLATSWRPEAPEAGFASWAAWRYASSFGIELPDLDVGVLPERRWDEAPVLAAIGYHLARHAEEEAIGRRWLQSLERLKSRDVAPADRNSFLFRPAELLGLAVGAKAAEAWDPNSSTWLREIITDHDDLLVSTSVLSAILNALAASEVGATWKPPHRIEPDSCPELALAIWLNVIDEKLTQSILTTSTGQLSPSLLERVLMDEPKVQGTASLAVLILAVQRVVAAALGDLSFQGLRPAQTVVELCRRLPLFISEHRDRHDGRSTFEIKDEYDVQDLLRSILKLHFDDVRPEEWNPSIGGVQSRSDLLLKAERVMVETKMTRKGLRDRELVAQLSADRVLYRKHPDCGTLVCFVYDPGRFVTNPTGIENDLSDADGSPATFVVISPVGL